MLLEIDNTRRMSFVECPRKFYYRWVQKKVSKNGATALRYGHVVHEGLATYYENFGKPLNESTPLIIKSITDDWADQTGDKIWYDDYRTLENAIKCVMEYILHYTNEIEYLKVVEVERKFTLPIPEAKALGFELNFIGRIDLIIDMGGSIYAMEHKTTGTSIMLASKKLYRAAQTIGYSYTLKDMKNAMGCIVNLLETTKRTKKKDGTYTPPKYHFARPPQPYTSEDYKNWLTSFLDTARQIHYCHMNEQWPMQFDGCYPFNSECAYTALCQQQRDIKDINYDNYATDNWDPRD